MAKKVLALLAAMALLLAFTACGNKNDPVTEPDTTTAEDVQANATTEDTTTLEDDTSEGGETTDEAGTTTAEEASTQPGETTVTEVTTTKALPAGKPSTTAEIIDYFNAAMRKVRADKPGYTSQERTIIDDTKISSSKGWLNTFAPPVIRAAKGLWSNWTDPSVKAKGSDHNGLRPIVDIQPAWVKSATCTESGSAYNIRIYLVDERVRELPVNEADTMHGKAIACFTKGDIADGAGDVGVDITRFDCLYSGSYIDCSINKSTGAITKLTTYNQAQVELEAKVPVLGTLDASLPLAQERVFTF